MRTLYLPCSILARISSVMGILITSSCDEASRWDKPAFFRGRNRAVHGTSSSGKGLHFAGLALCYIGLSKRSGSGGRCISSMNGQ